MVLLPTLLAARRGSGTMKALTPAGLTSARQVSPLTPLCLPDIPTPTTRAAQRSLCQSPQRHRLLPGFATNEQARHRSTPNQVRHPTDCRFISGCSPPRLTRRSYLQLRSPRLAPTRTSTMQTERPHGAHSFPRKRESRDFSRLPLGPRFRGRNPIPRIWPLALCTRRSRESGNLGIQSLAPGSPHARGRVRSVRTLCLHGGSPCRSQSLAP
jgi:hypothetical protein